MLKYDIQPLQYGFSNLGVQGGVYHCLNMFPNFGGLSPHLKITQTGDTAITGFSRFNWFAEQGGSTFAAADNGRIFKENSGWSSVRVNSTTSRGNGLIGDQKGRLLYASDQYLGMYDGSTWTDNWKDLVTVLTDYRPMETYEDLVLIGNGSTIALLASDDSINTSAFTLPSGFIVRAIKANRTGLLVGANLGNRGVVFLWDAQSDRSIGKWIWTNSPIRSIAASGNSWIVTTAKKIFLTDGYVVQDVENLPDIDLQDYAYNCLPSGTLVIDDFFLLAHHDTGGQYGRRKPGLFMLHLPSKTWLVAPVSPAYRYNLTMGGLYQDSLARIFLSYQTPSNKYVSQITNAVPTTAELISMPFGAGSTSRKAVVGIKPELMISPRMQSGASMSFSITAKVCDLSRPIWSIAVQSGTATGTDKINVNGTLSTTNNAQVGDEVTILDGQNAGLVRHITAIANKDTSSETWTLDSALTGLTESGSLINVAPWRRVDTFTYTTIERVQDAYFNVRNTMVGKQFLVKLIFDNLTNAHLVVSSIGLAYDDKGVI